MATATMSSTYGGDHMMSAQEQVFAGSSRLLTPSPRDKKQGQGLSAKQMREDRALDLLIERDYLRQVGENMYEMEEQLMPVVELIDQQPELKWYMRPYLINFLIEIHQQHRMKPETLYLAINIVDRYVSKRIVYKKHYQLVGCAALWLAAKFEDAKDRVPTVTELRQMCCGAYDESAFIQMEGHVLSTVGWIVGRVTCEAWLRVLSVMSPLEGRREPLEIQNYARFLMEMTLFQKEFVSYRPSDIAIGALLLARRIAMAPYRSLNETPAAIQAAQLLDLELHEQRSKISRIIRKKYSSDYMSQASTCAFQFYDNGGRFAYDDWVYMSSAPASANTQSSQNSLQTTPHLYSTPANARQIKGVSPFSESSDYSFEAPDTPITPLPFNTNKQGVDAYKAPLAEEPIPSSNDKMNVL